MDCVLVDDYTRTPPRAPKAVVVLVMRLVVANMAATYAGELSQNLMLKSHGWFEAFEIGHSQVAFSIV